MTHFLFSLCLLYLALAYLFQTHVEALAFFVASMVFAAAAFISVAIRNLVERPTTYHAPGEGDKEALRLTEPGPGKPEDNYGSQDLEVIRDAFLSTRRKLNKLDALLDELERANSGAPHRNVDRLARMRILAKQSNSETGTGGRATNATKRCGHNVFENCDCHNAKPEPEQPAFLRKIMD